MPTIKRVKGGFRLTHTTEEVWGVPDNSLAEFAQLAREHGHSATYTANHAHADWCAKCEAWFRPVPVRKGGR
jgi:hypothetical protein